MAQRKNTGPAPLPPGRLRAGIPTEKIPYDGTDAIPETDDHAAFQPRACQALTMALDIGGSEYGVFVAGEPGMGRTFFTRSVLEPAAAKRRTPDDWVYLHDFADPDRPVAVALPAGKGREFKAALSAAVAALKTDIPAAIEREQHQRKLDDLAKGFHREREAIYAEMEATANQRGFTLKFGEEGTLTIAPLDEGGEALGEEAFEKLDADTRQRLKTGGEELLADISGYVRRISQSEQELKTSQEGLHRTVAGRVLAEHIGPLKRAHARRPKLARFFKDMEADVLAKLELLLPKEPAGPQDAPPEDPSARWEANLFVDNSRLSGAPVVIEDHPTPFNLLGSIEREAELGSLYTDFSLIKAGALHKANGGFLILNTEDLLANPASWEGLLRALRAGQSRIEDPVDPEQVRARTIEPEPIPLDLTVILTGTDEAYEALLYGDDRFAKHFKLKAHLQHTAPRNAKTVKRWLHVIGAIARRDALRPFGRDALAALVELGSRLAEDQKKLSLAFPRIREPMIEASALARRRRRKVVDAGILQDAIEARDLRSNLFQQEFMADYDREVIKVATGGRAVGRANGLSVTLFGDFEFGLPHQIACTVGVGHGGILDLEREAQLGGPIHTKGMMILKSYLLGLFAQDKPIVLTGSLCFEQSYAGIEGDSASGAELAALLSALAGVPIDLSFAFTGAVSQSGAIMAVGGVTQKIEGFFEVCRRRGLTGRQGVLLPADNVVNLMLAPEVVRAVEDGRFAIHPVATIGEAMTILTGMPAGERGRNGRFAEGTLYRLVDERLEELAKLAKAYGPGHG